MNIGSKFITGVISKLVKGLLKKKLGYDVDILLNDLNISYTDGKAHIHLNADAELNKDELTKILKNIGLN